MNRFIIIFAIVMAVCTSGSFAIRCKMHSNDKLGTECISTVKHCELLTFYKDETYAEDIPGPGYWCGDPNSADGCQEDNSVLNQNTCTCSGDMCNDDIKCNCVTMPYGNKALNDDHKARTYFAKDSNKTAKTNSDEDAKVQNNESKTQNDDGKAKNNAKANVQLVFKTAIGAAVIWFFLSFAN